MLFFEDCSFDSAKPTQLQGKSTDPVLVRFGIDGGDEIPVGVDVDTQNVKVLGLRDFISATLRIVYLPLKIAAAESLLVKGSRTSIASLSEMENLVELYILSGDSYSLQRADTLLKKLEEIAASDDSQIEWYDQLIIKFLKSLYEIIDNEDYDKALNELLDCRVNYGNEIFVYLRILWDWSLWNATLPRWNLSERQLSCLDALHNAVQKSENRETSVSQLRQIFRD